VAEDLADLAVVVVRVAAVVEEAVAVVVEEAEEAVVSEDSIPHNHMGQSFIRAETERWMLQTFR
jgi:hypothetical protein